MSKTYTVDAKRSEHGWELHVAGVGVTQSRSLHSAAGMAREYISLVEQISDESTIDVAIRPQIDSTLGEQVMAARNAVHALGERQREVAALSRAAAKELADSGLSGADIAVVLEISPQRVSQLLNA